MPSDDSEPSSDELAILTQLGRMRRMAKEGLSLEEIARRLTGSETREEYVARNSAALDALEARILSPEYMQRFCEIQKIADPAERAAAAAELKRENFAAIDMEAVHRSIRARNRRAVAEGMLPPSADVQ